MALASSLKLPGPDLASIDIRELHQMICAGNAPNKTAQAIGISTDAVRLILGEYPAPGVRVQRHRGSLAGAATDPAGPVREDLERLYLHEALSIEEIAARSHKSRRAISAMLRTYGIPAGDRPPPGLTADWLQQEYIGGGCSLAAIGREIGVTRHCIAYWANRYGIPIRSPGGRRIVR
jgi:hypothetical protein